MEICEPCTLLDPIEQCTESIEIGIAEANTDYYVYVSNLATTRLDVFPVTSDGDGLITIPIDECLAQNTGYEIWINTTGIEEDRDDFTNNSTTNKCFIFQFMKNANPTPVTSTFNGMYVNGFTGILGNATEETKLKSFIPRKKINDLTFYIGDLFLDSAKRTAFRALATSLRTAGQTRIGSNVTKKENCIDNVVGTEAHYNAECTNANQKINVFTQEGEPWHENDSFDSFAEYKANDDLILAYCKANNITYDVYLARCRDVAGVATDAQCADQAVLHDTIFLVDYVSTTKFNTYSGLSDGIKEQLTLISAAAGRWVNPDTLAVGKTQKVVILYASEGNAGANMATYFQQNPSLLPANDKFQLAYKNWNATAVKSKLSVKGMKIYAYTGIKNL